MGSAHGDTGIPLKEFDLEMASTRKLLERVPGDKGTWKPHEKSFALGHLAQLVSWMPGWIATSLREPHIDLAKATATASNPTDALLKTFDANVRDAREALETVTGDDALDEHVVAQARRTSAVHVAARRGGPAAPESPRSITAVNSRFIFDWSTCRFRRCMGRRRTSGGRHRHLRF